MQDCLTASAMVDARGLRLTLLRDCKSYRVFTIRPSGLFSMASPCALAIAVCLPCAAREIEGDGGVPRIDGLQIPVLHPRQMLKPCPDRLPFLETRDCAVIRTELTSPVIYPVLAVPPLLSRSGGGLRTARTNRASVSSAPAPYRRQAAPPPASGDLSAASCGRHLALQREEPRSVGPGEPQGQDVTAAAGARRRQHELRGMVLRFQGTPRPPMRWWRKNWPWRRLCRHGWGPPWPEPAGG